MMDAEKYVQNLAYQYGDPGYKVRPQEFFMAHINIARTRVVMDHNILKTEVEDATVADTRDYTVGDGGDIDISDFLKIYRIQFASSGSTIRYDVLPLKNGWNELQFNSNPTGGPSGMRGYYFARGGTSGIKGTLYYEPIPSDAFDKYFWYIHSPVTLTLEDNQTCELGDEYYDTVMARALANCHPIGSDAQKSALMVYENYRHEKAYDEATMTPTPG